MTDPIRFDVSPNDGGAVRALLQAHLAYEQAKAMRHFWVHVLALLGAVGALCLIFPQWQGTQIRAVLLASWGACVACAAVSGGVEWAWRRRETRLLSTNATRPN